MDELTTLLEKLTQEVGALDQAIDARRADEERRLSRQESRAALADARLARARTQLDGDQAALAVLDDRRRELTKRVDSWRGQLWQVGHGSATVGLVSVGLIPLVLATGWFGLWGTVGVAVAEVFLFLTAFFLIPEKR